MRNGRQALPPVEKFKNANQKHFMHLSESIELSKEIGRLLCDFAVSQKPDVIFGIANGALLMTIIIAEHLGIPWEMIKICRSGTKIKETLVKSKLLLRVASIWYKAPILNIPLKSLMQRFEKLAPPEDFAKKLDVENKVVALVDDCIETGQTLQAAMMMLQKAGAKSILVAVMSWSEKVDSLSKHGIAPDIFINRCIQHYPWSRNSPFRNDYLNWLEANGLKEWS
jgi:adenine/guanine phosphoribosyltransferase-like PRPP-binding protein